MERPGLVVWDALCSPASGCRLLGSRCLTPVVLLRRPRRLPDASQRLARESFLRGIGVCSLVRADSILAILLCDARCLTAVSHLPHFLRLRIFLLVPAATGRLRVLAGEIQCGQAKVNRFSPLVVRHREPRRARGTAQDLRAVWEVVAIRGLLLLGVVVLLRIDFMVLVPAIG